MKHTSLVAAAAVVIATNAFVLFGVARNRSAVTEEIELTDRELMLQKSSEENSGVSLRQQSVNPYLGGDEVWFDQAKLAEAGFDVRVPVTDPAAEVKYRHVLPREVFAVFALGGARWEAWVRAQEEKMAQFRGVQQPSPRDTSSRLIAMDVGRDPSALRRRYPDQARFLIVRAVVRLNYWKDFNPMTASGRPPTLRGYIQEVIPNEIHVPLPFASQLAGATHYSVTLRYGSRYEPWVAAIRRM
jgi:hypothetical protein